MIPYPVVTVDMGQYLERSKEPNDMARLWIDYVTELAREVREVKPRFTEQQIIEKIEELNQKRLLNALSPAEQG